MLPRGRGLGIFEKIPPRLSWAMDLATPVSSFDQVSSWPRIRHFEEIITKALFGCGLGTPRTEEHTRLSWVVDSTTPRFEWYTKALVGHGLGHPQSPKFD
jgi:hypothetical protein